MYLLHSKRTTWHRYYTSSLLSFAIICNPICIILFWIFVCHLNVAFWLCFSLTSRLQPNIVTNPSKNNSKQSTSKNVIVWWEVEIILFLNNNIIHMKFTQFSTETISNYKNKFSFYFDWEPGTEIISFYFITLPTSAIQ